MIQGTSSMDRPVTRSPRRVGRLGLFSLFAILGLSTLLAWPALSRWALSDRSIDKASLRTAVVQRGNFERDIAVEGRVVAAQSPNLYSPGRGIVRLATQAGQTVQQGQILATLESPELENELQQERSAAQSLAADHQRQQLVERQRNLENEQRVDLLKVRAEAAQRAMQRARRNFEEGVVGAVDFEKAQDELRVAELELALAEKRLSLDQELLAFETQTYHTRVTRQHLVVAELERRVQELTVRSPVTGQVGRIDVRDRDNVTQGQLLISVIDLAAFEVEIGVPEAYAPQVDLGMSVEIRSGGKVYQGILRSLAAEVAASVVSGRVAFVAETPPDLKQSQRVTTRLLIEAKNDVLLLERGPFVESGGGRVAWVVVDGIARPQPIEVGAIGVGQVEILQGLEVGDEVVISETSRFAGAEAVLLR